MVVTGQAGDDVRYAKDADVHLAYKVIGDPRDPLLMST
jgi:hypothetical protein